MKNELHELNANYNRFGVPVQRQAFPRPMTYRKPTQTFTQRFRKCIRKAIFETLTGCDIIETRLRYWIRSKATARNYDRLANCLVIAFFLVFLTIALFCVSSPIGGR